jgi:DNA-binding response OmpR family regulator
VVNMCISALRRKLGPDVVVTVRREGYLIRS